MRIDRSVKIYGLSAILLLAFLCQCIKWSNMGYGPDVDGWGILGSWVAMKDDGIYVPSRNQGNLIAELLYGEVAHVAGATGTTVLSLSLSLMALAAFANICRRFLDGPRTLLAVAFVASCPYWVFRSLISTDYMLAVALFLGGVALYQSQWRLLGALSLAFAGSARLQYAPLGLVVILVCEWLSRHEPGSLRGAVQRILTFMSVGSLLYVPVFIRSRLTFSFLHVHIGDWNLLSKIGRLYKIVMLFGFPTAVLIGVVVAWLYLRRDRAPVALSEARASWAAIGATVAAATIILFFPVPIEAEYLFPLVFVVAAALAASAAPSLVVFSAAVLMIVNGYTRVDIVKVTHAPREPCGPTIALSARPGLSIEPGILREYGAMLEDETRCLQETMQRHLSDGGQFGGEVETPNLVPKGLLPEP